MKDVRHSLVHVHMTYRIHLKVDLARMVQGLLEALVMTMIAVRIAAAMIIWR